MPQLQEKSLEKKAEPSITLHVENPDQADATCFVGWCVNEALIEKLQVTAEANGDLVFLDPYVLLCIFDEEGREVGRKLVSLESQMEQLVFSKPGKFSVKALIVWQEKGGKGHLSPYFLSVTSREPFEYVRSVFCLSGEEVLRTYRHSIRETEGKIFFLCVDDQTTPAVGEIKIQVSPEFFAPEPSERMKRWVNLLFSKPPRDQCHFRRRAILAFTLQPVFLALWLPLKFLMMTGLALFIIIGGWWRALNFHPFRRLLTSGITDVGYELYSRRFEDWKYRSPFLTDKDGDNQPVYVRLLAPWKVVLVSVFALAYYQSHQMLGSDHPVNWLLFAGTIVFVTVIVLVVLHGFLERLVGFDAVEWCTDRVLHPSKQKIEERQKSWTQHRAERSLERKRKEEEARREAEKARKQAWQEDISSVVCKPEGPPPATLEALPPKKRTAQLRFQAFKASVCRPFAR